MATLWAVLFTKLEIIFVSIPPNKHVHKHVLRVQTDLKILLGETAHIM